MIVKPDWSENKILFLDLYSLIGVHKLKIICHHKTLPGINFWEEFYKDHIGTDYFEEMVKWMSSSPSVFLVIGGDDAVDLVRWKIVGRNGSGLRGKYQTSELKNVAHASDSEKSAERELGLVRPLFV